jgi:hypothetical protein
VRVHGQASCAQVWLADAARTVTDRRLCSPYRLKLPARSLAVLTFPAR